MSQKQLWSYLFKQILFLSYQSFYLITKICK